MAISNGIKSKRLETKNLEDASPKIVVFGVGGAGGNAVNNMIQSQLQGVEFFACNTDAQALREAEAPCKIQLGPTITQGLGAGSKPEVGRAAAEEIISDLSDHLEDVNMVFITAGMGGGTGTGAAPVVAQAAREKGILTVGVVTKPFHFEGVHRMRSAEKGIEEMQKHVDTLLVIPNQNLFRVANERTTFSDAFKMADDVLHAGVRGVTDLMMMPGLINLDFADVRTVMSEMGKAMMGTGEATGENRAIEAAEAAISNPLLDDVSMRGAKGVLISITGGEDLTLYEVDEAANRVREEVDADANIIFGSTFNPQLNGQIRVSVVATGIDSHELPKIKEPESQIPENYFSNEDELDALKNTEEELFGEEEVKNLENSPQNSLFSDDTDGGTYINMEDKEESHDEEELKHSNFEEPIVDKKPSFFSRLGFSFKKNSHQDGFQQQKKPTPRVKSQQTSIYEEEINDVTQGLSEEENTYDIPAYLRKK